MSGSAFVERAASRHCSQSMADLDFHTTTCFRAWPSSRLSINDQSFSTTSWGAETLTAQSDPTLWRIDRFREELACVVHTLELSQYHLWGHSWGAQLALNYAATKPPGLLSLTLAGPVIDIPNYRSDLEQLVAQLPPEVQTAIRNESADTVEYSRALNAFYRAHLHTMSPWPASWSAALSPERFGQQTYETMIGVDELHYTGALRDVDDSTLLPHVAAPMGIHCGSTDIATPQRCEQYRFRAGDAELEVFEGSSHAFFDEERSFYLERLQAFLLRCESAH